MFESICSCFLILARDAQEPVANRPLITVAKECTKTRVVTLVRVLPGRNACEAAVAQFGVDYSGTVPHLPFAQCDRAHCECKYVPIGSEQLRRQYSTGKSSSKSPH